MAAQLLAALTTDYHLLKREVVVYLVNLRHLLHSIPMDHEDYTSLRFPFALPYA